MKGKTRSERRGRMLGKLAIAAPAGALSGCVGATSNSAHANTAPQSAQNRCSAKEEDENRCSAENGCSG